MCTKTIGISQHAAAAKAIKQELNHEFPGIKFSVKSSSFSMGDDVSIRWIDGPTEKEVEKITDKYQYGYFNGMEDIYENTNQIENLPQVKYVNTSSAFSYEKALEICAKIKEAYGVEIQIEKKENRYSEYDFTGTDILGENQRYFGAYYKSNLFYRFAQEKGL